jgi:biotin carboxylase
MNVLFVSPGFPPEMPFFTRGLAASGARVIGLGDQPEANLPQMTRENLAAYFRIGGFADEAAMMEEVRRIARQIRIDRIECLWEPMMIPVARMREMLGLPGMTVAETVPFRDKEVMKQVLDRAGIRTPRHGNARSISEARAAAEHVGWPLVIKPIAGAGSADTYRCDTPADLERVFPLLRHVPEVSVEEFIEGEDFTFDTICYDGRILFENICFYRPRALVSRSNDWISPQTVAVRDVTADWVAEGRRMGHEVLKALNFKTGFTHMEWYRKPDGEAVFGEIGARSAGARTVDVMNWAADFDAFRGWAEAVCHGEIRQPIERKYNAVAIFKRAEGEGRIQRVEGLARLMAEIGPHICAVDLTPLGAPKRPASQTLIGDGFVMLRHPDLSTALELGDRVASELRLYAG